MKKIEAYAFLMSVLLLGVSISAAPTSTLTDLRAKPIPVNLPWYPIVFFGDNRPIDYLADYPPEVFYHAINEINAIYPIAVIGLGDHVGYGYESQYRVFYEIINSTRLENTWFIMGNHEVVYPDGWKYWSQYIGPLDAIRDDIPGWRIALLNTEADVKRWEQALNRTYSGLDGRKIILVFHRPAYPDVNHNIKPEHNASLHKFMNMYGWPAIAVQAHWHGWASQSFNGTHWIIAGSAGAPLYPVSDCRGNASCVSDYHYLVMVLYPNGTYSYTPVSIPRGSLSLKVLNSTAYLVENRKIDVYGRPATVPVRLKYTVGDRILYVVLLAPANKTIIVNINTKLQNKLETNATLFYAYYVTTDPIHATVVSSQQSPILANYGLTGIPKSSTEALQTLNPPPPPPSQSSKPSQAPSTPQTTSNATPPVTATPQASQPSSSVNISQTAVPVNATQQVPVPTTTAPIQAEPKLLITPSTALLIITLAALVIAGITVYIRRKQTSVSRPA
ncbi:MAG: hypothetical protein ACPLRJ_01225 [Infirmifilum uzonense]|uniref:metallophosphoesterase family protein n=1 Tax=Infirmifilum uzonense TaxID=1550241 RepID=UPI003C75B3C1